MTLKVSNLLPKYVVSFTLETLLKISKETNKVDVKGICSRVIKHASKKVAKAEINLN